MANYYVNSAADAGGNGTTTDLTGANCAFKTIAQVNAATFSAGDFVYFNKGQSWAATLIPPSSGTALGQITFGAYGTGAAPIIDATGLDNCVNNAKDYLTFDGLHFKESDEWGIKTNLFSGIVEQSNPGITVQNCTFTHCGCELFGPDTVVQNNTFVGPNTSVDIAWGGAIHIRGAVATDCIVHGNTISGYLGRGIWFMNACDSPTATDNIVYDIAFTDGGTGEGYGINFDGYGDLITGTVTATGNHVYNCASNGIELENCSDGSVIKNNLVHDCDQRGIFYYNYAARADHYADQQGNNVGAVISYNIIYNCNRGVASVSADGLDIWNNTIDDGYGSDPVCIGLIGTNAAYYTDIDVRNNIFGSGWTYVASVPGSAWEDIFVAFDYNRVFTGDIMYERGASNGLTLAEIQATEALPDAIQALNSFTDDPAFTDEAGHDYSIGAASPCVNAGVDVGLSVDYLGHSIVGVPDIGAYEYIPASEYHVLKRYGGAAWVKGKMMAYTGSAWEQRPLKRWDGDSWVDVDGLGE